MVAGQGGVQPEERHDHPRVRACVATVACILAFMVAGSLLAFAPLLAMGLLGVFVVQAPLCKPSSSAFRLKSHGHLSTDMEVAP